MSKSANSASEHEGSCTRAPRHIRYGGRIDCALARSDDGADDGVHRARARGVGRSPRGGGGRDRPSDGSSQPVPTERLIDGVDTAPGHPLRSILDHESTPNDCSR
eukprot:6210150-Pleurochrysis_carterae.AAC.1